jgi:hypothetical protein
MAPGAIRDAGSDHPPLTRGRGLRAPGAVLEGPPECMHVGAPYMHVGALRMHAVAAIHQAPLIWVLPHTKKGEGGGVGTGFIHKS